MKRRLVALALIVAALVIVAGAAVVVHAGLQADALYEKQLQAEETLLVLCLHAGWKEGCTRFLRHHRSGRPLLVR